jgi:phosphoglycolate phosphatase
MAVVTTRARPEAESFIAQLNLAHYFPVVVTRGDVLRMKPHPEPVTKAAEMLGVLPERCLMVGDTTMDMRAGRRAGAYTVGVLSGFGERDELTCAGADVILDRAEEILEML